MTQELATVGHSPDLAAQMDWARATAVSNLLPDAYRGKPENVMIAANLGASMGLSPAESLYRISVIQGKPTASAELVASNVRRAGHRLRVTGNDASATAVIIRNDDPDFEFVETWDMDRAGKMGLALNPNWKKQPGTMLKWRAITSVARLACPEALYGVAYTADEMDTVPQAAPRSGADLVAERIPDTTTDTTPPPSAADIAACTDADQLRAWWPTVDADTQALIKARADELKDAAEPMETLQGGDVW